MDALESGESVFSLVKYRRPFLKSTLDTFSLTCQSNIGDSSLLFYFQVYGLGEMKGPFLHSVNWTRRILFNKDQPPKVVDRL